MYNFGAIVLVPFPFTDLTSSKLRPALIVSRTNTKNEDIILAFITSKLPGKVLKEHYILSSHDGNFASTGLKTDSMFRFDKIATIHKKLILGEIGYVPGSLLRKMKPHFNAAFGF